MKERKRYEEHCDYLFDVVKLQLWFLWHWKRTHPDETIQSILRNRIDVYRKTDINKESMNPAHVNFDDPEWRDLEERIVERYQKHCFTSDVVAFENDAFQVVRPTIHARSRRDYEERPYVLDYNSGSLTYCTPGKKNPKRVYFHIANAIAPRSIFADNDYLPQCLLKLMEKSAAEYGADSLCTGTWLNSHPIWLKLFPGEWRAHMTPENRDVQWHFGFWGQFITARGTFNARLGGQLRETGEFPYWPRSSWCSFTALRNHLV